MINEAFVMMHMEATDLHRQRILKEEYNNDFPSERLPYSPSHETIIHLYGSTYV